MVKVDEARKAAAGRGDRRSFLSGKLIAILIALIAVIGGGAGYWFFFLGESSKGKDAQNTVAEAPLPFYLEMKPFVVSVANNSGTPHFVQLGLNLTLPDPAAGNVITAMLPELQDAMRQTVLTFKVDDIVTPAGIDKMREAMLTNVNRALLQRLGADRIKRLVGSDANKGVVQNILFSTLVVE